MSVLLLAKQLTIPYEVTSLFTMNNLWSEATKSLLAGNLAVLPTDTIYGLVGKATTREAIEKLDHAKQRPPTSPYIILIGSLTDLEIFDIILTEDTKRILDKIWPGRVSVVLPTPSENFSYLKHGHQNLAFRYPADQNLTGLIKNTGPLAAPSANPHGKPPATTIEEAQAYFGSKVDVYVRAHTEPLAGQPSTLLDLTEPKPQLLRPGALDVSPYL